MALLRGVSIGAGYFARFHYEAWTRIPEVQVVAACDLNEACVAEVVKQYDIPHVYTDFRKLLERDDLDAVDVCLHNNFHRPATEAPPAIMR